MPFDMAAPYSFLETTVKPASRFPITSPKKTNGRNLLAMDDDQRQRREALEAFLNAHRGKPWSLNPMKWAKASGRSESMIRNFLAGRNDGMNDASYTDLARGASDLLKRTVTAAELRGERPAIDVEVGSYVGVGGEVFKFNAGAAYDRALMPPQFSGEAIVVSGDSALPPYDDGDILYVAPPVRNLTGLLGRVVVAQIADNGPRVVKRLLRGSQKYRHNLLSINGEFAIFENQAIESAASIEWIRKKK